MNLTRLNTLQEINVLQIVSAPTANDDGMIGVNGPERRMANVVNCWEKNGIKPVIAYPKRGNLWSEISNSYAKAIDFEIESKWNIYAIVKLIDIVKKYNINIMHTQGPGSLDLIAAIVSLVTRVPLVITRPVMIKDLINISKIRKMTYYIIDIISLLISKKIIVVGEYGIKHLGKTSPVIRRKIQLVYNGIELDKYNGIKNINKKQIKYIENSTKNIGMVAQLTENKGWLDFIDVINNINKKGFNIIGHIFGGGPLMNKLKNYVYEKRCADKIKFYGQVNDIAIKLSNIDLFLFTSYREGLSVAIIEALASGLPIVATNVGAIEEQVINGENGFIVKTGDVDIMVERCCEILSQPDVIYKMGKESVKIAEKKFSQDIMVQKYAEIYRKLARLQR